MQRIARIAVAASLCFSSVIGAAEQPVAANMVLVLKGGVELRGQFVGFENGGFTFRLADGRTVTYPVAQVDRIRPATEAAAMAPAASVPAPAAAAAPQKPAAAPAQLTAVPASDASATSALEAKACGPDGVKFVGAVRDTSQHPTPTPPGDKALVFVVRPTKAGARLLTRLSIDRQWVGVTLNRTYFFAMLDPGEHYLCSQAFDRSVGSIRVEAGKTYYLAQNVDAGFTKLTHTLEVVSEEEGRQAVANSQLSVWKGMK